jgi:hypothetical protein
MDGIEKHTATGLASVAAFEEKKHRQKSQAQPDRAGLGWFNSV